MINIEEFNKTAKTKGLHKMQQYFKELPITIIDIDNSLDNAIIKTDYWTETRGMFIKREVSVQETTASHKVTFTFKDEEKVIWLDEKIMANKEALISNMKFDLGLR